MSRYFKVVFLFAAMLLSGTALADYPRPWQMGLQEGVTPVMKELTELMNFFYVLVFLVTGGVMSVMVFILIRFRKGAHPVPAKFSHSNVVEIIMGLVPLMIVIGVMFRSYSVLSFVERGPNPEVTVKVVARQWYWTYIYPQSVQDDSTYVTNAEMEREDDEGAALWVRHNKIEFDSNMVQDSDLKPGDIRLLEVDNRLVLPVNRVVRFLITASDVIHSFAMPSFGIKLDAVPGRVNEVWTKVEKEGVYYGQCSELCGINHGFMPIVIQVVSEEEYNKWLASGGKKKVVSNPDTAVKKS